MKTGDENRQIRLKSLPVCYLFVCVCVSVKKTTIKKIVVATAMAAATYPVSRRMKPKPKSASWVSLWDLRSELTLPEVTRDTSRTKQRHGLFQIRTYVSDVTRQIGFLLSFFLLSLSPSNPLTLSSKLLLQLTFLFILIILLFFSYSTFQYEN